MVKKIPIKKNNPTDENKAKPISTDINKNLEEIKSIFSNCSDIVFREFLIGYKSPVKAALIYVDGLIDKAAVHDHILKSLTLEARSSAPNAELPEEDIIKWVNEATITVAEKKQVENLDDVMSGFLSGDTALLIDGSDKALILGTKGWASRGIAEPDSEVVVRGPREGFTETLRINTSMVRRRIHSDKLKIESRKIGKYTQTDVAVLYMDGIVNPQIVKEVQKRLDRINEVDSILETGCIEQYIEDHPYSPFPQIQYTERPDKLVAYLLEGRVIIMVDGSPNCLIVPTVFIQFLQSPEDYYSRILMSTVLRWIRFLGVFSAVTLPALYIAVTTFHQEMIPTRLALSIAGAREGVPFPAFVEAFTMEVSLELLREASVRLPGPIGSTLGIVGALIVGQAAVEAKLVAPQMVIVVAMTAIGSFTVPSFAASIPLRLFRFPLMILGAVLGLYGVALGWIAILIHMISLKSFGYPYLEPLAPLRVSELKDVLIRSPRWQMTTAPQFRSPSEKPPKTYLRRSYINKGGGGK
ncbi:MAG: spore germination protein [Clostridia bacterium]|nr:spore germination protein [Clostridia bacterium]